tara:strand:+ start:6689 stop:7459 length:771 start_codon:yes stop_codon:yes gene_type:complete
MSEFIQTPKVLPVNAEIDDPRIKPVHPNIPQPPALLLGIGAVKSGKTTLINNLLLRPREEGFYGQEYFDNVQIISNTILNDPTARFLRKAFDIQDYYNDGMINNLIKNQKSYGEKKDMPFIALLLDDILGSNMKRNNEVSFLATRYRHHNIGLMGVFTQNFKSVDTILRNNATDVIIFKQTNNKQLMQIAEEFHPPFNDIKTFLQIYYKATAGKYNFLYLKVQEGKALRNFEDILFEDNKMVGAEVEIPEEVNKMT